MARPGSFGVKVKARLPRVEVLQFHQFAVPDWSGRRCASRSSRMAPAMSRNRRKEPPISAVAVPEWGRSSASPSRAWVRASLGPKPLPTGSPSGRKRPGATRPEPEADRRRPPRRLVRNRVRNIRPRRCRRESPSRNPRKSACGGDARICGNRAGSCHGSRDAGPSGGWPGGRKRRIYRHARREVGGGSRWRTAGPCSNA